MRKNGFAVTCSLIGFLYFIILFAGYAFGEVALTPYISSDKIYALHKPTTWKTTDTIDPDFYRVKVTSPDEASLVDFYWARNLSGNPEAASALLLYRKILSQTYQKVTVEKAWETTSDQTRIVADIALQAAGVEMKGRFYIEATETGISAQGYAAPVKMLASRRPLLLNIMSSMAFLKVLHQGEESGSPVQAALVTRRAPDGSLTVRLPGDWDFLAAQGKIVAGAPGGGMGFIFTAFSGNPMLPDASIAQGVIGSRYLTPDQTVPFLLQGFGHSSPEVTSSTRDTATMDAGRATLGRECDAADISAVWMSSSGMPCMGVFKVMNTLPAVMEQWSSVVMGIWGPQTDFIRYVPLLEEVASSYAVNDAFARSYIQSGLANLRRLQQKTGEAIRSLNDARADNQAAWEARQERKDYMDSKWDDYRRGNSYWVSDIEGGRIYQTDSSGVKDMATGDYYEGSGYSWVNFEGRNPRHPSEDMRELSSYEVEHGEKPN